MNFKSMDEIVEDSRAFYQRQEALYKTRWEEFCVRLVEATAKHTEEPIVIKKNEHGRMILHWHRGSCEFRRFTTGGGEIVIHGGFCIDKHGTREIPTPADLEKELKKIWLGVGAYLGRATI